MLTRNNDEMNVCLESFYIVIRPLIRAYQRKGFEYIKDDEEDNPFD